MSHANAPLTPTGRLRLARCVVEDAAPTRSGAVRGLGDHRSTLGRPVPRRGRGWDGRPLQPTAPLSAPDPATHRAAGRGAAGVTALGPGAGRLPPGHAPLHRPQDPHAVPVPAPVLHRPRRRITRAGWAPAGAPLPVRRSR